MLPTPTHVPVSAATEVTEQPERRVLGESKEVKVSGEAVRDQTLPVSQRVDREEEVQHDVHVLCMHVYIYPHTVNPVIYAAKKIYDFVLLSKILFLLNNIYSNQIPGQSTCVKSFIL